MKYRFFNVYKKIYKFFIEDLGCKYFDLIKDRLYIFLNDSNYRISVQFIFFFLLFNFIKLISPILSFTAEEVWLNLPIKNSSSIFLSKFNFKILFKNKFKFNVKDLIFWDKLFYFKNALNKVFESFKADENIKSFLEIEIKIFCNKYWYNILKNIENNLNSFLGIADSKLFFFNNTDVNFLFYGISFNLNKSYLKKCERCWNKYELEYSNLKICKKCIFILYYKEFNNINL